MSEGLAETEWVASWIGLRKDYTYKLRDRHKLNREFKINSILSESRAGLNMAAICDAKSLYDNLNREQYSAAEKIAALEICVIKDSLDSLNGSARCIPHEETPVDCMTKLKGNASAMLQMLQKYREDLRQVTIDMKQENYTSQAFDRVRKCFVDG